MLGRDLVYRGGKSVGKRCREGRGLVYREEV